MPIWLEAGAWGLLGGLTLVVGALVAWLFRVPRPVVAGVMAFGAGVLISALAFELVDEAERTGGLGATASGFLGGAVVYVAATTLLAGRRRRPPGRPAPSTGDRAGGHGDQEDADSGAAIAIGALLDGIPESVVLGVTMLDGGRVSPTMLAAVAISNLPEGLSSAAGMKQAGRSARTVFGVWGAIALSAGLSALLGCLTLQEASPVTLAFITAVAAGAILAMVADTMIPEAFARTHLATGLITTLGFLTAFTINRW